MASAIGLHCPVDGSKHSTLLRCVLAASYPPAAYNLPSTTATPWLYRAVLMGATALHSPVTASKQSTLLLEAPVTLPPKAKILVTIASARRRHSGSGDANWAACSESTVRS